MEYLHNTSINIIPGTNTIHVGVHINDVFPLLLCLAPLEDGRSRQHAYKDRPLSSTTTTHIYMNRPMGRGYM